MGRDAALHKVTDWFCHESKIAFVGQSRSIASSQRICDSQAYTMLMLEGYTPDVPVAL